MMNNSYEYMVIDDTSYHMLKASAATEITRKAVFNKFNKDDLIAINKAIENAAKAGKLRIDYTFKGRTEVNEDAMSCITRFLLSCGYFVYRLNKGIGIRIEWNP